MMPTAEEVRRALTGAVLLLRGQPAGMGCFDLSVEGFWKSFAAALLVAPGYAFLLIEQYATTGLPADLFTVALVEIVAYAVGCVAFPIAAIFLTQLLGLGGRYVPLIVAGNWSSLPQVGFLLAALLVSLAVPSARPMVFLAATLAAVAYQWFVARTALQTSGLVAFGLVVVDVLLSIGISLTADGILAPQA